MIYFRGCVAREKLTSISDATKEILDYIQISYKLVENESCCGSFLLRTGFEEEAREVMKKTMNDIGDEKVLVSCAGCYKTLKEDYKEILSADIDIVHTSQFFKDLIDKRILELEQIPEDVTYHDPCHLGRHLEEYDAPRSVIKRSANLVEMEKNKENARCCGAGAGVRSAYPEITREIGKMRVEDAEKTGAKKIVTTCPFCIFNLESASDREVMDISQIILKALKRR